MAESDFERTVLSALNALSEDVAHLRARAEFNESAVKVMTEHLDFQDAESAAIKSQLRGIVARLDEQDTSGDLMAKKLDRMSMQVMQSWQASEQALNALTSLSQRVVKLEHPDANGDAAE